MKITEFKTVDINSVEWIMAKNTLKGLRGWENCGGCKGSLWGYGKNGRMLQ